MTYLRFWLLRSTPQISQPAGVVARSRWCSKQTILSDVACGWPGMIPSPELLPSSATIITCCSPAPTTTSTTAHGTAGSGDYRLLTLSDLSVGRRMPAFFLRLFRSHDFPPFFLAFVLPIWIGIIPFPCSPFNTSHSFPCQTAVTHFWSSTRSRPSFLFNPGYIPLLESLLVNLTFPALFR